MHQKTLFIADHLRGTRSVTQLCEEYGISRKTGYKWIDRYIRRGPQGLEEQSRRPRHSPRETPAHVVSAIIEVRHRHPSWGAKKILSILHQRHPHWALPHRATGVDILNRHGLIRNKPKRRHIGHPGKPTSLILAPNQLWCVDFKGQFRMGNGQYCYPLTLTDGYSRFLLGCQGLHSTAVHPAKPVFARIFKYVPRARRARAGSPPR